MNRLSIPLAIGMSCLLLLVVLAFGLTACGVDPSGRGFASGDDEQLDSADDRSGYLSATVEPCSPVNGSDVDPCERRFDEWDKVRSPYRSSSDRRPVDPPTIEASINELFGTSFRVPHLIVRGTVVPGTTRCDQQELILLSAFGHAPNYKDETRDTCFSEIRVNEYIVGRGPSMLTVSVGAHHKIGDYGDHSGEVYYEWLEGIHSIYEGREWVMGLHVPIDFTYAAWRISDYPWDLQQTRDGELIVVDWMARSQPELSREENGFEISLDEFRTLAKRTHAEHLTSHDGRTGEFEGAPFVLNDANYEFLHKHMSHGPVFSVVDATPHAPPPALGENDPYTPGQNVTDQTATVSPEVPGGLEDTPTPVSALGDEPTATATAPTPESEVSDE